MLVVWRDFTFRNVQCNGQSNVDTNMGHTTDNLTHISGGRRAADIQKMYLEGNLSVQPVTDELVHSV